MTKYQTKISCNKKWQDLVIFQIKKEVPTQLAFGQQPISANTGVTMSPITVLLQDASGNTVTTSSVAVTIALTSGSGLTGTLTRTTSAGVATFNDLSESVAGNYTLTATATGLIPAVSNSFAVAAFPGPALTNLVTWGSADSGTWQNSTLTTPATANNDPVGGVTDRSGNSNHAIQATAGNRGTLILNAQNGLPCIRFDGISQFLECFSFTGGALSQPLTIFFAFTLRSGTGGIYDGGGNNGYQCGLLPSGGGWDFFGSGDKVVSTSDNNPHVMSCVYNGASSKYRIDNGTETAIVGTIGVAIEQGFTIGANHDGTTPGAIDVYEWLVYSGEPSSGNKAANFAYLTGRWLATLAAEDTFSKPDNTVISLANYTLDTSPAGGITPANCLDPHAGDYYLVSYDNLNGGAPIINPWPSQGWLFWIGCAEVVGGKCVSGGGQRPIGEDGDFTALINVGCQDLHQRVSYQWAAVDATNTTPIGFSFAQMGCLWQSVWTGMGSVFGSPEGGRVSAVMDGTNVYCYVANSLSEQAILAQAPYPLTDGQTVTVDLWAWQSTGTFLIQVNGVNTLYGSVPSAGSPGQSGNFMPFPHRLFTSIELYRPPVFSQPSPVAAPASKILHYQVWALAPLSPVRNGVVNWSGDYIIDANGNYLIGAP